MKVTTTLLFILTAGIVVLACQKPDAAPIVQETSPVAIPPVASTGVTPVTPATSFPFLGRLIEPEFVVGKRQMPVNANPLANWLTSARSSAELGDLKNGTGSVMMVFGDGLAAGWRDGGLFREGQQTAFPNLVAIQMGLANFKSPLFDETTGNGTGYLTLTQRTPGPRWQETDNNLGIVSLGVPPVLAPYTGGEIHNWGVPKISRGGIGGQLSPAVNGWSYGPGGKPYTDDMPFFWRMFPTLDKYKATYYEEMFNAVATQKPKLVLCVFEHDRWTDVNVGSDNVNIWLEAQNQTNPLTIGVADAMRRQYGIESIAFTLPYFRHQAYFNYFTAKQLAQLPGKVTISTSRTGYSGSLQTTGDIVFLPTKAVEDMFERARKGESFSIGLSDKDVADANELTGGSPAIYNDRIRRMAALPDVNVSVVDLEKLYQRIYEGSYTTDDGYKIDGSPTGNFFSSDGLYPSPIGNAVIANETIKVINQRTNARVPLINVSNFARSLGK